MRPSIRTQSPPLLAESLGHGSRPLTRLNASISRRDLVGLLRAGNWFPSRRVETFPIHLNYPSRPAPTREHFRRDEGATTGRHPSQSFRTRDAARPQGRRKDIPPRPPPS